MRLERSLRYQSLKVKFWDINPSQANLVSLGYAGISGSFRETNFSVLKKLLGG